MVRLRAYLNQVLSFQVTDVAYMLLIHPLLETASYFVVNWGWVGAVKWLEIGQYEFWCGLPGLAHIFDSGTCTMSRHTVLLEVPRLPWQLPQLVLRCFYSWAENRC